ncbi:MAG: molybdopterin-dependent oxidoreductase [Campylobacterota bacterium]|nr:molybdopterin-dependent oxidoreductase [Campylobacterota bacterium]
MSSKINKLTACSLDCYDACAVVYSEGKLKGFNKGHTRGFLCPHLKHYSKHKTITTPRYKNREVPLSEALEKLKEILKNAAKDKILHYRGSGNFGLMQEVTDHFFASYGATLTDGTLCDGAGEAGIIKGRGSNKNMPLDEIVKSEIVIIWGRNPHTTSSHLLPLIKNKTLIVIDPIRTKIAKSAELHIQLKPHTDLHLAMILIRFLKSENRSDFEAILEEIDVSLEQVRKILELVQNKKVAIVCGVGIQKYSDGADVMRAIDTFAMTLGLFSKEGCGVSYLGNSKEGIISPFQTQAKRVSKVDTAFDKFSTVFIQGANPLSQMPDTLRVKESISKVKHLIYFGLYENETSEMADLVIPAKSFLYKNDVRASYSHNSMMSMSAVDEINAGISEYELSAFLCEEFGINLESEEFYLSHFKSFAFEKEDGCFEIKNRENTPYKEGFDTDDGKFVYLESYKPFQDENSKLYLITPKSATSLNSQFNREKFVYLHSSLGFKEGSEIVVSSENGEVTLPVKINSDLRDDCVLIYSATEGVNNLTTSKHSDEGKSAIFQENRVEIRAKS